MYKNEKEIFVEMLVNNKIVYTEYFKEGVLYVVSNSKKYDFPSAGASIPDRSDMST